jgi:hypothetical protein
MVIEHEINYVIKLSGMIVFAVFSARDNRAVVRSDRSLPIEAK